MSLKSLSIATKLWSLLGLTVISLLIAAGIGPLLRARPDG